MQYISFRLIVILSIISFIGLTLSGCATAPQERVVYKTRTVYHAIPDSLTTAVIPKRVVSKTEYLSLLPQEREIYLSEVIKDLYRDVNACNTNLNSIKKLQKTIKEVTDEGKPGN